MSPLYPSVPEELCQSTNRESGATALHSPGLFFIDKLDGRGALVDDNSMKRMSMKRFARLVGRVMDTLPPEVAQYLDNVVVDVEEEPNEQTLRAMDFTDEEIAAGDSLYGLFVPMDVAMPEGADFLDYPHRILIYKRPLEEDFPDPRQLCIEIRKTVIHEVAHHFSLTDRDLERFDNTPDPFGGDTMEAE
jgi:predicted Zn-dependent protease with MMP-like domain